MVKIYDNINANNCYQKHIECSGCCKYEVCSFLKMANDNFKIHRKGKRK